MPKKDMDYSKTIIYKICCKDLNITDIYIGHTTNLVQRRYNHKSKCNNDKGENYNLSVYQFIRDNGGWDNWDIIEIDKCHCLDFEEARKVERNYIEKLNATLNSHVPGRTHKEYLQINKDYFANINKKYRDNHIEEIKNYMKYWREENKEKIKENKRKKITCECGCCVCIEVLNRHKTSQRHIRFMEQLKQSVSS
jgi:hypothetical protein